MGLLRRLGKRPHRWKVVECPVIFRFFFGPKLFHRQVRFSGLAPPVRKVPAHDLRLLLQPAGANAEENPAVGKIVQGGNLFGEQQGIALRDQTDARPQLERRGDGRGPRQSHKGVSHVTHGWRNSPIWAPLVAGGHLHGDDRMLRQPQRLKS